MILSSDLMGRIAADPDLTRDFETLCSFGGRLAGTESERLAMDFVGERGAEKDAVAMLRQGGTHIVIGYGGRIEVPTIDVIFSEIAVVGSLVGNYTELSELMILQAQGKVKLHTHRYALDDITTAVDDLDHGRIRGRGVVLPRAATAAAAGATSSADLSTARP